MARYSSIVYCMVMFHVLRLGKLIVRYTFCGLMDLCCMRNVFYLLRAYSSVVYKPGTLLAYVLEYQLSKSYGLLFAEGMNGIIVENNVFGSKTYTVRKEDVIIHGTHGVSQKSAR